MESNEVFEVILGKDRYYVRTSAKHHLETNLNNYGIKYDYLRKTSRKIEKVGTSLFMDNTLEHPVTVSELKNILNGKRK